jgi:hypothetical protein
LFVSKDVGGPKPLSIWVSFLSSAEGLAMPPGELIGKLCCFVSVNSWFNAMRRSSERECGVDVVESEIA